TVARQTGPAQELPQSDPRIGCIFLEGSLAIRGRRRPRGPRAAATLTAPRSHGYADVDLRDAGDRPMPTDRRDDLRAFRDFLDEQIADGGPSLTPWEALDLWELQNPTEAEREETLEAIREGLEDLNAGRTRPAREVLAELRRKYDLPGDS